MIRLILGFLLVFGAVGGLDNPQTSLLAILSIALLGMALMMFGARSIK